MKLHVVEDEATTIVHTVLDLRGDHFESTGKARRNPVDRRYRSLASNSQSLAPCKTCRVSSSRRLRRKSRPSSPDVSS